MKKLLLALSSPLILSANPTLADFRYEEGSFFVIHRDYDHKTDTFSDGAAEGEEDACFQLTKLRLDGPGEPMIDFVLVSGRYSPWWADGDVFPPGFEDAFVPAIGFTENRPDAEWTELLDQILLTVPSCPAPATK